MFVTVAGVYGSSVESTSHMPSAPPTPPTAARWASADLPEQPKSSPAAEAERMTMYRCIISSIVESETIYLECLDVVLQVSVIYYLRTSGVCRYCTCYRISMEYVLPLEYIYACYILGIYVTCRYAFVIFCDCIQIDYED